MLAQRECKIVVLQELSIRVCTEYMAWNVLKDGLSKFLKMFKDQRKLRSFNLDFPIQTDHDIEHNRSHPVAAYQVIDIGITGDA